MPIRRQVAEPFAIIIAPTQELVIEVHATFLDLCWTEKARCVTIYGGATVEEQLDKLRGGCDILIVTPGRLLDFLRKSTRVFGKRQFLSLSRLRIMVHDEVDIALEPES